MLSSVLDNFCSILNSFHDAVLAASGTFVIEKSAGDATREVNCISAFVDQLLELAANSCVVVHETGKRTTSFPGAYLTLCLTPIFRLTGNDRWARSGLLPSEGIAHSEKMYEHSAFVAEHVASGYNYLKSQARLHPDHRHHNADKYSWAKGLISVMLNMLAMALGFTLYSRTEDPTQSIKQLLFGDCGCAVLSTEWYHACCISQLGRGIGLGRGT